MPQSLSALYAHIVFSTKGRVPLLTAELKPRMHAYIAEILRNVGCEDPHVGGVEDHVHIVCGLPRTVTPAHVLMTVKKDSSIFAKTLHDSLKDFHWQSGYGLFSVSQSHLATVRSYVQRQEEHHRVESFQEEYRRLLSEAGVEFDERYMWD